jgi:hypothetical protein
MTSARLSEKDRVMKKSHHPTLSTAVRALLLVALPLTISLEANANTPPPWYPGQHSVGHLMFYNASGQVVTGGAISDPSIAAHMVASTVDYRGPGDTKATAYAYTPVSGEDPLLWPGEQLTLSSNFPVLDSPPPLGTCLEPVDKGGVNTTLAGYIAALPNMQTTGPYAGLYELRMFPGGPNGTGALYWNTVISVDTTAGTWSVDYP